MKNTGLARPRGVFLHMPGRGRRRTNDACMPMPGDGIDTPKAGAYTLNMLSVRSGTDLPTGEQKPHSLWSSSRALDPPCTAVHTFQRPSGRLSLPTPLGPPLKLMPSGVSLLVPCLWVNGSTATKTYGKSATVGEHEEQHMLPCTEVFGKDVDERQRLCQNWRAMSSPVERRFAGTLHSMTIT
jgi:hypothetical protein